MTAFEGLKKFMAPALFSAGYDLTAAFRIPLSEHLFPNTSEFTRYTFPSLGEYKPMLCPTRSLLGL